MGARGFSPSPSLGLSIGENVINSGSALIVIEANNAKAVRMLFVFICLVFEEVLKIAAKLNLFLESSK